MRADARRNYQALLAAARDVFIERGPDVALDEIARRAGVGIATLYRRFPARSMLVHAVVVDALDKTYTAAQSALEDSPDPLTALSRYLHALVDLRTPAVIPTLLEHLDLDSPDLAGARQRSADLAEHLVNQARDAGVLRQGVTFADVALMLVRIARALPGPIDEETQRQIAHRHVDLLLSGLRADPHDATLAGTALERDDLEAFSRRQTARNRVPSRS